MTRRIVVTGARGFIGGHLVDALTARGDQVTTVVVRAPCDHMTLVEAFRGADCVVHLAGVIAARRDDLFTSGNVDVTRAVAAAAREAGAHLVHTSSLAAAGPAPPDSPRSEDDPSAPVTAYGRSKLESERAVLETPGLRWTILRPGVVYGPRERSLLTIFRYARSGWLPLVGRARAAYMFIHIDDAVRAIVAAVDRAPHGEIVFVGHPRPVFVRALVDDIRAAVNPSARIVPVPPPVLYAAAMVGEGVRALTGRRTAINHRRYVELMSPGFVCRVDRLRDRLGVVPQIDLADGIRSTAEWYREAGWI